MIRKIVRVSTLGLVGDSPKNRQRKAEAKLADAQRKALESQQQYVPPAGYPWPGQYVPPQPPQPQPPRSFDPGTGLWPPPPPDARRG